MASLQNTTTWCPEVRCLFLCAQTVWTKWSNSYYISTSWCTLNTMLCCFNHSCTRGTFGRLFFLCFWMQLCFNQIPHNCHKNYMHYDWRSTKQHFANVSFPNHKLSKATEYKATTCQRCHWCIFLCTFTCCIFRGKLEYDTQSSLTHSFKTTKNSFKD